MKNLLKKTRTYKKVTLSLEEAHDHFNHLIITVNPYKKDFFES